MSSDISKPKHEDRSWLPMLVGGIFATLAISGSALVNRWKRRIGSAAPAVPGWHRRREEDSLAKLREAIIGNDRESIVKVFGPPPTTGGYAVAPATPSGQPEYYRAETWYYPMDPVRQHAIAIEFENDVVREAHVIQVPLQ